MSAEMLQRGDGRKRSPDGAVGEEAAQDVRLEHVVAPACLALAWKRVRQNKGGPGGDGMTLASFQADLDARLERLRAQVLKDDYRPRKVRRASMPKADGSRRKLAIPSVVDRILQTATMLALGRNLDGRLSDASWAYREHRGVNDALAELAKARSAGLVWTLDADITHYFDRVPHRRLLEDITIWIGDVRIIRLIRMWLRSFSWWGRGIAQGSPISPLLANLFLHPMDRVLELEGFHSVRYADDFLVLCPNEKRANKARKIVSVHLTSRGLTLNAKKTRIVGPRETFDFLGQRVTSPYNYE